jgi:hypothetical protein
MNINNIDYKTKYLKYKTKYLSLKELEGGGDEGDKNHYIDPGFINIDVLRQIYYKEYIEADKAMKEAKQKLVEAKTELVQVEAAANDAVIGAQAKVDEKQDDFDKKVQDRQEKKEFLKKARNNNAKDAKNTMSDESKEEMEKARNRGQKNLQKLKEAVKGGIKLRESDENTPSFPNSEKREKFQSKLNLDKSKFNKSDKLDDKTAYDAKIEAAIAAEKVQTEVEVQKATLRAEKATEELRKKQEAARMAAQAAELVDSDLTSTS